jgi:integrase
MWKELIKNNTLENQRYYYVIFDNVKVSQGFGVVSGLTLSEPSMPIPYSQVVEKLKTHFSVDANATQSAVQQFRNHMSALNGFLASSGKTIESNVGSELASQFGAKLNAYLANLDVAPRTLKDRAVQMKTIKRIFELSAPPTASRPIGTLAETLRKLIGESGVAPKRIAKEAAMDPGTLYRWIAGATPRADTIPALRRLESRLGLSRDSLVSLSKTQANEAASTMNQPAHRARYAEMTKESMSFAYSELSASFLAEWKALFDYKVDSFPSLERHAKGQWRLIPKSMAPTYGKVAEWGKMTCPTAFIAFEKIRSFLGVVVRLPMEEGGIAWRTSPNQSLALLAHPRALGCYLQWLSERSDGIRHDGHRVFAQFIACLLRPQTGYLWQQPSVFRARLPEELRPESDDDWKKMCESSHQFLRNYIPTTTGTSRHPEEPIANLLALDDPLRPILDAIQRIQTEAASCPPGGITQARHKRDALLLALLLSNPLRMRSIASLTWLPNGQGSIRGSAEHGWRIVLQPAQLKNGGSKAGRAYNVKIADWVKPLLEEYLEEYRDTLLAGLKCDYLFVGDKEGGIWEEITHRVLKLTRRYIPGSPGFGPHAFRHLVATTWLRKNPGDFLTVAELLNDTLSTVLANYAHLRRDDSFARYEAQLSPVR